MYNPCPRRLRTVSSAFVADYKPGLPRPLSAGKLAAPAHGRQKLQASARWHLGERRTYIMPLECYKGSNCAHHDGQLQTKGLCLYNGHQLFRAIHLAFETAEQDRNAEQTALLASSVEDVQARKQ